MGVKYYKTFTPRNFNFVSMEEREQYLRFYNIDRLGITLLYEELEDNLFNVKWCVCFGDVFDKVKMKERVKNSKNSLTFRGSDLDNKIMDVDEFVFNKLAERLGVDGLLSGKFSDWLILFRM